LLAGVLLLTGGWLAASRWLMPADEAPATYVGSEACAACHAKQFEEWTDSHHQLAMCEANRATVRGDFDDRTLTHQGITSRFFREGDRFLVTTEGADGKLETFPIKYTFGLEPLQQYLVEFPGGRLQALSLAWDTGQKRWFHLYPDEKIPADDVLHWTKPSQNWNYMCAECHSTNLQKNYELATDSYRTTFSEISVGCEACHGPGSTHVELARSRWPFRGRRWGPAHGYGLAPLRDQKTQIDTCAMCHARRGIVHPGFKPGSDFLDHYIPELLDNDLYFADGQIRDEVYEYGSFLQSKMYRAGVRCTDCHNPHVARTHAEGNNLCTRCHVPGRYDGPFHHHHPAGSRGSRCVECHMPARTYMVVDPRRDHSIRVPRPDLTVSLGTPNACNGCHHDRTPEWARDQIIAWHGSRRPDDPHYAPALAAGKAGRPEGEPLLIALSRRKNVGPVVRASATSLLGRYPTSASRQALVTALADADPLVRAAAIRALERHPDAELDRALPRLLQDRVRLVRAEAARALSSASSVQLSEYREPFRRALAEYVAGQLAVSDHGIAHHNLGIVHSNVGELQRAETAYRTALRLDPRLIPPRYNLAMLYNRMEDKPAAERTLRELISQAAEMADAHYSLGLLLAENEKRIGEAAESLATAARLDPNRGRIQYNYGLALQRLGRRGEAETALLAAHKLEPASTDYLYALASFYGQQKRWSEARRWVDELLRVDPSHRDGWALGQYIQRSTP
jgi:tetratricopeptide (TPR) repeat protein